MVPRAPRLAAPPRAPPLLGVSAARGAKSHRPAGEITPIDNRTMRTRPRSGRPIRTRARTIRKAALFADSHPTGQATFKPGGGPPVPP